METAVTILRELWHKRIIVGLFAIVAIAVGALVAYKPSLPPESRKYEVGKAHVRILVDTPASQAVEVAPKDASDLGARANLLANLMVEGEVKRAIAKRAGLDVRRLLTVGPSAIGPNSVSPAALHDPKANILTTRVVIDDAGAQLPIIDVDAQAVDARSAEKLANAAVSGLGEYLDSKALVDQVSATRRLRVMPLGAAQGRDIARGPGAAIALAAAILIFAMLCAVLLLGDALARGWRVADLEDELGDAFNDAWQEETVAFDEPAVVAPVEHNGSGRTDAEVGARSY